MPTAVFVRDAALAYIQKKTVLPSGIDDRVKKVQQEVQSAALYLKPIVAQADSLKRLTQRDIRRAAKIALHLDRQLEVFSRILTSIPHDR